MIYFDERGEVIPEMEGRGGVLPKWHILCWKLAGTSPSQEIGPYIQKITDGHWKLKSVPGQQLHAGSQELQRSETPEEWGLYGHRGQQDHGWAGVSMLGPAEDSNQPPVSKYLKDLISGGEGGAISVSFQNIRKLGHFVQNSLSM